MPGVEDRAWDRRNAPVLGTRGAGAVLWTRSSWGPGWGAAPEVGNGTWAGGPGRAWSRSVAPVVGVGGCAWVLGDRA